MNANTTSSHPASRRHYCITIEGHLDPRWSEWFENLKITQHVDGTTSLCGAVTDQATLYGLLIKLRDMGLKLLAVEDLGVPPQDPDQRKRRHTESDL